MSVCVSSFEEEAGRGLRGGVTHTHKHETVEHCWPLLVA